MGHDQDIPKQNTINQDCDFGDALMSAGA